MNSTKKGSRIGSTQWPVPVFTLESNNECLPKFALTDNASSSVKTANGVFAGVVKQCLQTTNVSVIKNLRN